MVLSFDLDDVLASFQKGWIEFNERQYGEKYEYEDFKVFDYSEVMNITMEEAFKRIFEFYESDIFTRLEPVLEAIETVTALSKKHELYVVTSRSHEVKEMSEKWINRYFPGMFKELLFTGQIAREGFSHKVSKVDLCLEKGVVLHVDDAPLHVPPLVAAGVRVVVLETPWNRNHDFGDVRIERIKGMKELLTIVEK